MGDHDSANHWLGEYLLRGGTAQGLKTSIRRLMPLEGMSKTEKLLFLSELDEKELALVVRGIEAFVRMFEGPPTAAQTGTRIYGVPLKR